MREKGTTVSQLSENPSGFSFYPTRSRGIIIYQYPGYPLIMHTIPPALSLHSWRGAVRSCFNPSARRYCSSAWLHPQSLVLQLHFSARTAAKTHSWLRTSYARREEFARTVHTVRGAQRELASLPRASPQLINRLCHQRKPHIPLEQIGGANRLFIRTARLTRRKGKQQSGKRAPTVNADTSWVPRPAPALMRVNRSTFEKVL